MGFSAKQLGQIVAEMEEQVIGAVIQKIDQPQPWDLVFEIHQKGKRHFLYFSAHRQHARLHLLEKKYENPPAPPRFSQLLRSHLRWKRILSLEQIDGDRIVRMRCAWAAETGAPLSLVAELMGPASNFFLLDAEEVILGALFPPSSKRGLQVGMPYRPPPQHRAAVFTETAIPLLEAGPYRFNRSVEAYFRNLEEKEARAADRARRLSDLEAEIGRREKKLIRLAAGLAESEKSALYRRQGELLKSHLHEISPGMTEFKYIDPADPERGEQILALDPALSPSQNLERFFKRYKKAQSARTALEIQAEQTRAERDRLEKDRQTLLEGGTVEVVARPVAPQKDKKEKSKAPAYLSTDGLVILVGRNDRENDEVTFRSARGNDLWFHARGMPGSHVVVRMERRQEIPYQTLLDAATLALHFSDGRKTGKGDVLYTFKKYVQKPKGEKPGKVICSQDKNLYIELKRDRLERLLQSKIVSD